MQKGGPGSKSITSGVSSLLDRGEQSTTTCPLCVGTGRSALRTLIISWTPFRGHVKYK